jgi:hypothetical protein
MKLWSEIKAKNILNDILQDFQAVQDWSELLQATYDKQIDSWGYRWTLSCWLQSGLNIISSVNLVSNIGFGVDSTNTNIKTSKFANMTTEPMEFPLKHPPFIIRNVQADNFTQNTLYKITLFQKFKKKIKNILGIKAIKRK